MRIWEILNEKRSHEEMNPRVSNFDQLLKYAGRKDIFVSFTTDVGFKSHTTSRKSVHSANRYRYIFSGDAIYRYFVRIYDNTQGIIETVPGKIKLNLIDNIDEEHFNEALSVLNMNADISKIISGLVSKDNAGKLKELAKKIIDMDLTSLKDNSNFFKFLSYIGDWEEDYDDNKQLFKMLNRLYGRIDADGVFKINNKNISGAKLGINPKSEYDTPIGVYAYPVDYVLNYSKNNKEISSDFTGTDPWKYLWVIQNKDMKSTFDVSTFNNSDYDELEAKLGNIYNDIDKQISNHDDNSEPESVAKNFDDIIENSKRNARKTKNEIASVAWNLIRNCSKEIGKIKKSNAAIVWNVLMRTLGYNCVVDNGNGLIHNNEPTQAVFFDVRTYKKIDLITKTNADVNKRLTKLNEILQTDNPDYKEIAKMDTLVLCSLVHLDFYLKIRINVYMNIIKEITDKNKRNILIEAYSTDDKDFIPTLLENNFDLSEDIILDYVKSHSIKKLPSYVVSPKVLYFALTRGLYSNTTGTVLWLEHNKNSILIDENMFRKLMIDPLIKEKSLDVYLDYVEKPLSENTLKKLKTRDIRSYKELVGFTPKEIWKLFRQDKEKNMVSDLSLSLRMQMAIVKRNTDDIKYIFHPHMEVMKYVINENPANILKIKSPPMELYIDVLSRLDDIDDLNIAKNGIHFFINMVLTKMKESDEPYPNDFVLHLVEKYIDERPTLIIFVENPPIELQKRAVDASSTLIFMVTPTKEMVEYSLLKYPDNIPKIFDNLFVFIKDNIDASFIENMVLNDKKLLEIRNVFLFLASKAPDFVKQQMLKSSTERREFSGYWTQFLPKDLDFLWKMIETGHWNIISKDMPGAIPNNLITKGILNGYIPPKAIFDVMMYQNVQPIIIELLQNDFDKYIKYFLIPMAGVTTSLITWIKENHFKDAMKAGFLSSSKSFQFDYLQEYGIDAIEDIPNPLPEVLAFVKEFKENEEE